MRNIIAQPFETYSLAVQVTAIPLAAFGITALIDAFMITTPSTAANSVFISGNPGVTVTTGLELLAGTTVLFRVENEGRQMYELQKPLIEIAKAVDCTNVPFEEIPFKVWDMTQIFVVAAAITTITFAVFRNPYI